MKPKPMLWGIAIAAGLATLTAEEPEKQKKSTEPVANIPKNVRIYFEYIEMPLPTMTTLMDDKKATVSDTSLRSHVANLIKKGKAQIIETQIITVPNGQKGTTESIREFIYPTEYEPPELSNTVHIHKPGAADNIKVSGTVTGPTPTAFETRNLGQSLEVEASISPDDSYISMRYAPEIVTHLGNTTYVEWKDDRSKADIVMPLIYTLRITGAINVANAKPALLATLSPKNEKGVADASRKILVFGTATVISAK